MRTKLTSIFGLALGLALAIVPGAGRAGPSVDAEVDRLRAVVEAQQHSIDELRTAVEDLSAREAETRAPELGPLDHRTSRLERLVGDTRLGGWIDFRYGDSTKRGSDPQLDAHHFYLYLDSRLDKQWSSFAELEFEHAPHFDGGDGQGEIKLERLYIQYRNDAHLKVQLGKFNTPFGYWTPVHWAILQDTIQKPIHEDNAYVPRKQVGFRFFGDAFEGTLAEMPMHVDYSAWLSSGTELFGTDEPEDGSLGIGADLRLRLDDAWLFGASTYRQKNPRFDDRQEQSFMLYADVEISREFVLRGELFHQQRGGGYSSRTAGYAKLRWDFADRMYANLRVGLGDDDKRGNGDSHQETVLTLGYSPIPNVRMKLEWAYNRFDAPTAEDFHGWGFYTGFFF
ncbi:MAG: hypothetical protein GY733_22130 [bacterium]|nr:hypothetical protein [bacterium]